MKIFIPFNEPPMTGNEERYILEALRNKKLCGDGPFTQKCHGWFEEKLGCAKALLTPSCTHALEMAAILIDIQPGDEVIMPSYTFVSTANAFVLRGAKIVFVDIRPDTMNIDETLIEAAITPKTKAIVPVHYAGVGCEMDTIMEIANRHGLFVIEDAAQGMMSTYKGKPLGTIGHLGTYSFHETKNYTSGGEGGLLIVNDERFAERAEIIREKGTNRSQFFRGMVDKYSWVDLGSSYLPSELQAAYLWGQLEKAENINEKRIAIWHRYNENLQHLEQSGHITLPTIPDGCIHNAHMFYIKVKNLKERTKLLKFLKEKNISAVFHYVPLHSSRAGMIFGHFHGQDIYTTKESECIVRLPLYYSIKAGEVDFVIDKVHDFF
ncbi:dTDP-4-amino-4,6-dideoxygalactose transaminase [Hydrogenimonas cancrithermarum]|uniref:dTDP-4-amino-4,6-dideoxygalactose transaminase n=2 Tax=Hydrogenimonas cancrithermarum TaxID=2993563 RepID=A0ABN6WZ31_9BACT|nr:dTDP-4-amino-4,6-dideoxygalactose transaminase [Hydrogenimonas cancrithermarum]BDY13575.1 dTDP-4-amino-4,6-dideoxygalactose transaminase [Hydrogenimonas cancrithermarum]